MIHGCKLLMFWAVVNGFRLESVGSGPDPSPSCGHT